jgi:hypothetical protein
MSMRKILFATLAAAAVFAAVPASAQVFLGADRGGAGVQVGPFGVGIGPRFGWRDHGYRDYGYRNYDDSYAYGGCQLVRERFVTPRGHVVFRTRRACY